MRFKLKLYDSFVTIADVPDKHPCYRECSSDPATRMTCGYNFTMEYFWVLSKACYDCPNVTSDCSRFDCIPADGVRRGIAVVNRMMPGPAIRVKLQLIVVLYVCYSNERELILSVIRHTNMLKLANCLKRGIP
jgi:hypothetical protein